ncbi:MAG: FAD-dependent oxidoreductase [Nitriliruptoraceae bacterium]
MRRLVVIGGDAAGMSAASQARRLLDVNALEIVVFEQGATTSYAACGIPYWVADVVVSGEALIARTPQAFRDKQQIDVRINHRVVAFDTDAKTVTATDLENGTDVTVTYDELLIATGASSIVPPIDGIDLPGVYPVKTLPDGAAIRSAIDDRDVKTVAVVGGGYIGVEMAEAFVLRGLEVHVIDAAPTPLLRLDSTLGEIVAKNMRQAGIHLLLDAPVTGFVAGEDGHVAKVVTAKGEVACDLVVLGLGVKPNSQLAVDAGIAVAKNGGIITDATQRTPVANVWAAGDCTAQIHRVSGERVAIALGTVANKQGRCAGTNLAGGTAVFPGVLGTAVTKVLDTEIGMTGLSLEQAQAARFAAVGVNVTANSRAHYYPGGDEMTVRLVAEVSTGRLLGAEIVGGDASAKRIDTLATAIWNDMSALEVSDLDLSYAPPFSPVYDPVLQAARVMAGLIAREEGDA